MPSTKVYLCETMFALVLVIVLALLGCTEGNEWTNTTKLPYSNAQNSTVSIILNELNETSVLSTTGTEKATDFDLIDTSIGSSSSSSIEKQEFPLTSPINSGFSTLPGGNELRNMGEYSNTDSSQDAIITDTSVTQSDSSSKITWSPGISLSILSKEGHPTTSTQPTHTSESEEIYLHHTTPNIYNSLNHNENELDAEVRDGEPPSTMNTAINNPTTPTVKISESMSTADPGTDGSFPVEGTTSRVNDEITFSPISYDSESEHPKTTDSVKEDTPEPFSITKLSSSSMSPKTSTLASEDNFNTISELEKDSSSDYAESSAQTASNLDRPTISHETKKSESPFRHTRNTKSMADFATTDFSDHSAFNTAEKMSTTQESVTPANGTNSTIFNPTFPISSTSPKLETTPLPKNFTENEFTSSSTTWPVSTSHTMNENISIQDSETESPAPLHSITTVENQEETSIEIQTDLSASKPSQMDMEMKPSIVYNTENDHDVGNSFVTSTISSLGDPTQTFISEITSPTTQNDSSSGHFMNTPNVTSTTVLNITAMQEIQDTTSDSLLKITVPFDEKASETKDVSDISDIPAELSTMESDVTAVLGNQETTPGRLPRINDILMETTHSSKEQPSTVLSTHIFDENIMVTTNVSNIPTIPDEFSTLKSVDSESDGKEILSLTSNTEITDDPINQNSSLTSPSTDVTTHQKLDDITVKDIGQLTTTSPVDPSILSSITPTTTINPSVTQDQVSSTTEETPISRSEFQSTFFDSRELTSLSSIDTTSDVYTSTRFVEDPLISSNPTTSEHTDISTTSDLSPLATTSFFNQASSSSSTTDEKSNTFTYLPLTEVNTEDPPTTTSPEDISSLEVTTLSSSSSKTSASIHVFPSMLSTSEPSDSTGEILQTTGMESNEGASSSSSSISSFDYTSVPPSNPATETHREGKRIPFSTESSRKSTVESSNNVIFISSTQMLELETTTISIMEEFFNQLYYEDLTSRDQDNVITAVIQLPSQDMDNLDIDSKVSSVHNWLTHVLMKEFQNWTKDPFDETESNSSDVPFGKISIFYLSPTPNIQSSNITMSFIVHNQWRNDTLPVDFVLSILKFYSEDFKQSMNATLVDFYHGLPVEDMDLLPLIMEKYGAVVFIAGVVAIGSIIFICVLVIYKKRHRRSIHYLSTGKLQHNLPESVGIDLTPDVVILQDEKKILNGNNKICDDEGWLVPIHEVPLAEDSNMPKVQDTKL